jgi:hypothetical protein
MPGVLPRDYPGGNAMGTDPEFTVLLFTQGAKWGGSFKFQLTPGAIAHVPGWGSGVPCQCPQWARHHQATQATLVTASYFVCVQSSKGPSNPDL